MTSILDAESLALLGERRIGSLGTVNSDGTVHLTAIWYLVEGNRILIPTSSASRKAKNVEADGTASVMVDVRTDEAMKGVVVRGHASIVSGAAAKAMNRQIHERYLTDEALDHQDIGPIFEQGDDATVVVEIASVVTWDMGIDPLGVLFRTGRYLRPLAD